MTPEEVAEAYGEAMIGALREVMERGLHPIAAREMALTLQLAIAQLGQHAPLQPQVVSQLSELARIAREASDSVDKQLAEQDRQMLRLAGLDRPDQE